MIVAVGIAGFAFACSEESEDGGTPPVEAPQTTSPFDRSTPSGNETPVPPGQGELDKDAQVPSTDSENQETDTVSESESEDLWGLPEDPEEGEFGWPCDEPSECNSGWCIQTAVGKVCTEACLENCPPSWACSEVSNTGSDTTFICKPKYLHLCDPCTSNEDCVDGAPGAKCINTGDGGSFCGVDCSDGGACPTDFECNEIAGPAGLTDFQCQPVAGECTCSPLAMELGLTTTCQVSNASGQCPGVRACIEGQGLSICDGETPSPEVCDGLDNNCDGIPDNIGEEVPCAIENEFGSCPGVESCVSGVASCTEMSPLPKSAMVSTTTAME